MIVRLIVLAPLVVLVAACAPAVSGASGSPRATASANVPAATAGCVDDATARQIWTQVDKRLNAIALDPQHTGLSDVATGIALTGLERYIADTLVAKNLTEREVDTLNSLAVDNRGCNGGTLQVTVRMTLTTDDYLRPDGRVDHSDPLVGTQSHLAETYERVGGVWKQSSIKDLDAPSPSAQIV